MLIFAYVYIALLIVGFFWKVRRDEEIRVDI